MCEFKLGSHFLNLAVPILAHFFKFNNPLGLVQKTRIWFQLPCTLFTLLYARYRMDTKFYKKFKPWSM